MRRITMREDLTPIDKKKHRKGDHQGGAFQAQRRPGSDAGGMVGQD